MQTENKENSPYRDEGILLAVLYERVQDPARPHGVVDVPVARRIPTHIVSYQSCRVVSVVSCQSCRVKSVVSCHVSRVVSSQSCRVTQNTNMGYNDYATLQYKKEIYCLRVREFVSDMGITIYTSTQPHVNTTTQPKKHIHAPLICSAGVEGSRGHRHECVLADARVAVLQEGVDGNVVLPATTTIPTTTYQPLI